VGEFFHRGVKFWSLFSLEPIAMLSLMIKDCMVGESIRYIMTKHLMVNNKE